MKLVHVPQPWASLIAWGLKRSLVMPFAPGNRGPAYDGWIALYAADGLTERAVALCRCETVVLRELKRRGHNPDRPVGADLPCRGLVGLAHFVDSHHPGSRPDLDRDVRTYGNPFKGRWVWELADGIALPEVVDCKWRPSWNDVPPEAMAEIARLLGPHPAVEEVGQSDTRHEPVRAR